MVRRPPHLGGEPLADGAEGLDRAWKEQRLADGHRLRPEALLARLGPKGREVGRNQHARHDLDLGVLERRDLRGEIVEERLRSEEHTSELQSRLHLVCRLLLEKKKNNAYNTLPDTRDSTS